MNVDYAHIRGLTGDAPQSGDGDDEVDMAARRRGQVYSYEVEKYKNPRGGQFQAGRYPVLANVLFGRGVDTFPDGRLVKAPLADGVFLRQDKDIDGSTVAVISVAKLDHANYSGGILYSQKFLPFAPAGDKRLKRLTSIVRSCFDHKGTYVQFSVIDRGTLLATQGRLEDYKDLMVHVVGYSAQLIVLAKEVQDNIINRTEQTLQRGSSIVQ